MDWKEVLIKNFLLSSGYAIIEMGDAFLIDKSSFSYQIYKINRSINKFNLFIYENDLMKLEVYEKSLKTQIENIKKFEQGNM